MCFLLLAPAQGSDPKKCDPRLLKRKLFEGSEPLGKRQKPKKKEGGARLRNRPPSLAELLERSKRAKKIGDNPNHRHRTNLSVGEERVKRYGYKVQSTRFKVQGTRYKYGHGNLDLVNMFDVAWHPPKYSSETGESPLQRRETETKCTAASCQNTERHLDSARGTRAATITLHPLPSLRRLHRDALHTRL